MRELWKSSDKMIGSRRCIELKTVAFGHTNIEYSLSSRKGEIWQISKGRYAAVLIVDFGSIKPHEERYVRFEEDKLEMMISQLEIPKDPNEQTPWANTFGRRKEMTHAVKKDT